MRGAHPRRWSAYSAVGALTLSLVLTGCQTLRELTALRSVDFSLDRVGGARLAGVDLMRITSYDRLSVADVGRITMAVGRGELPLEFDLYVQALNPAENGTDARLVAMDWTLFLEERETISGRLDQGLVLPPGEPRDFALTMGLDLLEFVEGSARDLVDLALSVTGQGGAPKRISLRAAPTIETALGTIQYPRPITIVSREVGS